MLSPRMITVYIVSFISTYVDVLIRLPIVYTVSFISTYVDERRENENGSMSIQHHSFLLNAYFRRL